MEDKESQVFENKSENQSVVMSRIKDTEETESKIVNDLNENGDISAHMGLHSKNDVCMMPGLPPIDINELAQVLRGPNMPAQKIMKEVADQIIRKSEESESDDGSVGSGRGVVGMKGIFDCILEVSLMQQDSDNSDEEEDEENENITREIPCRFCNKIFGNSMSWKTHVLVVHPQQDPSVLNKKWITNNEEDKKEKNHAAHKRGSRSSSKSDCDSRSRHPSKTESKLFEQPEGEENSPIGKRRSSLSKFQQKPSKASDATQTDLSSKKADSQPVDEDMSRRNSALEGLDCPNVECRGQSPKEVVELSQMDSPKTEMRTEMDSVSSPSSTSSELLLKINSSPSLRPKDSSSKRKLSDSDCSSDATKKKSKGSYKSSNKMSSKH
ncbi:unnamed protein product [Lymnaea stagnalis]|uniref:C2H2-type domain-containing protein n=1 Tax=Lymnaea stagnalis TaxID=6523 RepID=A0AAV2IMW7_LYMST